MTDTIHNLDIGTIFELTIQDADEAAIDVSTATVKYIDFKAPDNTASRKTATFTTDGTDGKIKYALVDGDINQTGVWKWQGYVETSDGKFRTEVETFTVEEALYTA